MIYVLNEDGARVKEPINPALVALLGTALGIVGTIATTSVAAYYTSQEHMEDRMEARAKARNEALIKAYVKAVGILTRMDEEASQESSKEKVNPKADPEAIETTALLRLTGSKEAVDAFEDGIGAVINLIGGPRGAELKAIEARSKFMELARIDLERNEKH